MTGAVLSSQVVNKTNKTCNWIHHFNLKLTAGRVWTSVINNRCRRQKAHVKTDELGGLPANDTAGVHCLHFPEASGGQDGSEQLSTKRGQVPTHSLRFPPRCVPNICGRALLDNLDTDPCQGLSYADGTHPGPWLSGARARYEGNAHIENIHESHPLQHSQNSRLYGGDSR